MSTHLAHALPWSLLEAYYQSPPSSDPGIDLPVGDHCGRIHLISRDVRLKVQRRPYLQQQGLVCQASMQKCPRHTAETKRFYKNNSNKEFQVQTLLGVAFDSYGNYLHRQPHHPDEVQIQGLYSFVDKFLNVLDDFVQTERKKYDSLTIEKAGASFLASPITIQRPSSCRFRGAFDLVYELIEDDHIAPLLYLNQHHHQHDPRVSLLHEYFSIQVGSQAVGNAHRFLVYHLLQLYVATNVMIAAQVQNLPQGWHETSWMKGFMYDCDGRTFLEYQRHSLAQGVYMVDMNATRSMLKNVFRFFYVDEMLHRHVYGKPFYTPTLLLQNFPGCLHENIAHTLTLTSV